MSQSSNLKPNNINEAVFRIPDTAFFLWHKLDDVHIVYDKRSGHSQVLNDFAKEIFDIIEQNPGTIHGIIDEFSIVLEDDFDEALKSEIHKTIAEFDQMGLIEPVKK